jgi:hypothetical protein
MARFKEFTRKFTINLTLHGKLTAAVRNFGGKVTLQNDMATFTSAPLACRPRGLSGELRPCVQRCESDRSAS